MDSQIPQSDRIPPLAATATVCDKASEKSQPRVECSTRLQVGNDPAVSPLSSAGLFPEFLCLQDIFSAHVLLVFAGIANWCPDR
jgi:hypothetical protein